MIEETPFYLWTITEAWQWLIDVPGLGLAALIFSGIYLCARFVIFMVWLHTPSTYA